MKCTVSNPGSATMDGYRVAPRRANVRGRGRTLTGGIDMADRTCPYEVAPDSGCWIWQGYRDRNGYGRAYGADGTDWAHRVYYVQWKGPIPDGHEIDHVCQNRPCVNPDHLEAVTKREHVRRTWERTGRFDECLRAARLRSDGLTYGEIAEVLGLAGRGSAFGVVQSAITWGLVGPDDVPPTRRVTSEERADMRDLHALGVSQKELGSWYRIDSSMVSRIVNHKTSRGKAME